MGRVPSPDHLFLPDMPSHLRAPFDCGPLHSQAYLRLAGGCFPDRWRRVRDEVHTEIGADGLDEPSNSPLMKRLWWNGVHVGPGTTGLNAATATTFAPNVPVEDVLQIHHEYHHCRSYHLHARSKPSIPQPGMRSVRWPGIPHRCGSTLLQLALHPDMGLLDVDFNIWSPQCQGPRGPRCGRICGTAGGTHTLRAGFWGTHVGEPFITS